MSSLKLFWRIVQALWRSGLLRASPWVFLRVLGAWWKCGTTFAFLASMAAIRFPYRIALHDEEGELTFRQLFLLAEALAASLRLHHQLVPASQVAILCRNHRGFVVSLLASARLGLDVLTVGSELPPPVLSKILARQKISLILHDPEFTTVLAECAPGLPARAIGTQGLAASSVSLPRVQRAGNLVVLTSGSTGLSKGIRRRPTFAQILPALAGLLDTLPFQMHRPFLLAIPLHHGYGIATLAMSLTLAAPLHMARRFEIAPLLAQLPRPEVALLVTVPTLLVRWLRQLAPADRPSLAGIITGSAPLDGALSTTIGERLGPVLFNLYGSTEAGLIALATPAALAEAPGTVGCPLPGNRVRLVDPSGKEVRGGEIGRIHVRGPLVLTPDQHGWCDTGDVGRLDPAGRLFVCGRADSMFVSGGENVYPHEVEELLAAHPAVAEVAIVVVPDAEFGQRMLAAVVPRPDSVLDEAGLRDWLRARAEPCKLPRSIRALSAIPRNALGKVDRVTLTRILNDN